MNKVINCREDLARNAQKFITDGCKILVHSFSRAVLQTLTDALHSKKHFVVYVTEAAPDYNGKEMYKSLTVEGIKAILILDSAVGYIMERVDLVLVGAEGVAESGGVINKVYNLYLFYISVDWFLFCRLALIRWQSVPKLTISHSMCWRRVTNLSECIHWHSRRFPLGFDGVRTRLASKHIHWSTTLRPITLHYY